MRDKALVHYNMSRIKGKDTSIEILLRHALYHNGIRYRKNPKGLPGHPDIVLTKYRIVIFCDGDFFHGYDLTKIKGQLKTNADFWLKKIETNRKRDEKNDILLSQLGYKVLHFWEHEIRNDLQSVLDEIYLAILERKKESETTSFKKNRVKS